MRLSNFSILTGPTVTVTNIETNVHLLSGSSGAEVTNLDSKGKFYGFMTHFGNDTTENPYGNVNFFSGSHVNTDTKLVLSQSVGGPITGSAQGSFLFVIEKNYRG